MDINSAFRSTTTTEFHAVSAEPAKTNNTLAWAIKHPVFVAFLCLLLIEICTYGSIINQIGIYLDEWTSFYELHFCHQSYIELIKCILLDSRYIIRPLAAIYFGTIYYFCHEKPLAYHLLNHIFELSGAFFLYLALANLLKNKLLSFVAAVLFLIYPSHDLTRYSIGAVSTTTAITLYTLSLWLFTQAITSNKNKTQNKESPDFKLLSLSALCFLVSLFSYEICLPLTLTFIVSAAILLWKKYKPIKVLCLSALYTLPVLSTIGLAIFYRTSFLPHLGLGWGYRTSFNPTNFVHVICEGIKVSISPYAFSFFLDLAHTYISNGFYVASPILLVFATMALIMAVWEISQTDKQSSNLKSGILCIFLGSFILISAYLIFGYCPVYMPVLDTHINRVNSASSIGAAMIIAGLLWCLSKSIKLSSQKLQPVLFALLTVPCLCLFILADWQFACPWIVSWQQQKQVIKLIKKKVGICSGDTIILADFPRYIRWASVFDGVWDFQSALRINLDRIDINGGVLTDRMVVTRNAVEDRFKNYLCASYPYKQMFLLVPSPEQWIPVNSSSELISLASKYGVIVSVDRMYKMPLTKPFSFKCHTIKKRFENLRKKVAQQRI